MVFSTLLLYGLTIVYFTFGLVRLKIRSSYNLTHPTKEARFNAEGHLILQSPYSAVSVIVPTRNEEKNILRVLLELIAQDYPGEFLQVIVTDDFSEDNTVVLVSKFSIANPEFPLIIIDAFKSPEFGTGKKKAIERAIDHANGDIILCTDADTWRSKRWVTTMAECFHDTKIRMSLGPVFFNSGTNILQKIQEMEFLGIIGLTAGSAATGFPVMCNGANLAYLRKDFHDVGGFSGNLNFQSGDDQFLLGSFVQQYGRGSVSFILDRGAIVTTDAESTWKGFLSQRVRWISKSSGYRDPIVIAVGLITWTTIIFLVSGIFIGIVVNLILVQALLGWIIKIALDFPLVWIMNKFSGKHVNIRYFILTQIFQLLYVPVISILGMIVPYQWKGRKN